MHHTLLRTDDNLEDDEDIKVLFAHVRAATPPSDVDEIDVNIDNSHPFQFNAENGRVITFMHNGGVVNKVDRELRAELGPEKLQQLQISGNTDSELAGGILAEFYNSDENLENSLISTLERLHAFDTPQDCTCSGSSLNIAVTDGFDFVASRYVV